MQQLRACLKRCATCWNGLTYHVFFGNGRVWGTGCGLYHLFRLCRRQAAGGSIPASEHSTITSWGVEGECDAMRIDMRDSCGEGGEQLVLAELVTLNFPVVLVDVFISEKVQQVNKFK